MSAEEAIRVKFDFTPGDDLGKHGLTKIKDPFNKYFPVAIVGVGVHMPEADNLTEFQKVLDEERCVLKPIPSARWSDLDYYSPDPTEKGRYCITKLGFYDKYFSFDPGYFNISRREANFIDAQQRQVLMTAEHALQDAGIDTGSVPKDTGVYIGMGIIDTPGTVADNRHLFNGHTVGGFSHSCAANRVSHHYGLNGPSCAVDTACAASLTAVHVAVMSLWNGECRMAIAGATSQVYSPECVVAFSQLGVLSATGNCAPFDESNNGYVRSEGTGIVILKHVDDAVRDGDHIYCLIRGTCSAHNGYSMSLTLPSAPAQVELIERCYETFGVDLSRIPYVEAHGTGTPVGDPIEVNALGNTFGKSRPKDKPLKIASAKSNFGHLEVAAGMVQVVKAALMLEQRKYFKHINWSKPNHRMDLATSNIQMQLKHEYYTDKENMLIGVNTFGFGGSLVHQIFEEYRFKHGECDPSCLAGWKFGSNEAVGRNILIPFSARTKSSLVAHMRSWSEWNNDVDAQQVISWTATRRGHYDEERLAVIANGGADFRKKIASWLEGSAQPDVISYSNGRKAVAAPEICLVYSGWGQQWIDMGRDLYATEKTFRKVVNECDTVFKTLSGYSALDKFNVFQDKIDGIAYDMDGDACKPTILFFQLALTELLKQWGITGRSFGIGLGELSAAYASGALSLITAIKLMHIRMSAPPEEKFKTEVDAVLASELNPKSENFYSAIEGSKFTRVMDSGFWWSNVTKKPKIKETIDEIVKASNEVIFLEVSGSAVLSGSISDYLKTKDRSNAALYCGLKNEGNRMHVLRAVGELYSRGFLINWQSLTLDCPKHTQAPLYCYDYQEFCMESTSYKHRKFGWVDKSFKATLGKIDVYLQPHLLYYRLDGKQIFPAAGFVEYFAEYDLSDYAIINSFKFYESIEVPECDSIGHYTSTEIKMIQNGSLLQAISGSTILAEAEIGRKVSATLPTYIDVNKLQQNSNSIVMAEDIYQKFEDLGLEYGPHYKNIVKVFVGDDTLLAMCNKPHPMNRHERIETVVLESAFQAAVGIYTRGDGLYLPHTIDSIAMLVSKVPPNTPFTVYVELKKWSLKTLSCDMVIADTNGKIWVKINGFEARSRVSSTSNIELDKCIYQWGWQGLEAGSHGQEYSEECSKRLEPTLNETTLLESIVTATSQKIVKNKGRESDSLIKFLAEGGVESLPNSCETFETDFIMKCGEMYMGGNTGSAEIWQDFLKESPLVDKRFNVVANIVNDMVLLMLRQKHVVRIMELGSSGGILTKCVIQLLQDMITQKRVDYVYHSSGEEESQKVQEYNENLPLIKFQHAESEDEAAVDCSFDIVINCRFSHNSGVDIPSLLIPKGVLLDIHCSHSKLASFISGRRMDEDEQNNYWESFAEVKPIVNDRHLFQVSTGTKRDMKNKIKDEGKREEEWIIISDVNCKISKAVSDLVKGPARFMSYGKFFEGIASLRSCDSIDQQIVMFLDGSADMIHLSDLLINNMKESLGNVRCYIVNLDTSSSFNSAALGLFRAAKIEGVLSVRIINVNEINEPGKLADNLVDVLMKGNTLCDVEIMLDTGGIKVPRLLKRSMVSSTSHEAEKSLQPGEVMVHVNENCDIGYGYVAFAGKIQSTHFDNKDFTTGDKVMGYVSSEARYVVCKSEQLFRLPIGISWSETVAYLKNHVLAFLGLVERAKVSAGDCVLFLGPYDNVTQAAVQIALFKGAKVIVSSQSGIAFPKGKGVHVVDSDGLDFFDAIQGLTNQKGVSVVVAQSNTSLSEAVTQVLSVKARICFLGVDSASSVRARNVRQFIVNYSMYLNTVRGREKLSKTVDNVTNLIGNKDLSVVAGEPDGMNASKGLAEISFNPDGSYLVVGGFGRLGQEMSRWLAQRGVRKITIATRRKERNPFDNATIKFLENLGCSVNVVVVGDITAKDEAREVLLRSKEMAPLRGIFYVAGGNSCWTDGEKAEIDTHALGVQALSDAEEALGLEFEQFVALTSAVGSLPIPQLSSVGSNASYVSSLMTQRRLRGHAGLAYQIGLVRGAGYVSETPDLISMLSSHGMKSMHFHEYLEVLGNLLLDTKRPPVVMVTNQNWTSTISMDRDNLYFRHLDDGGLKSGGEKGLSKWEEYELMTKELIAAMTCSPIDIIESSVPVQAYGVDSLMSQEIIAWAEKRLKVNVEQAQIFAGLTIAQLVDMAV